MSKYLFIGLLVATCSNSSADQDPLNEITQTEHPVNEKHLTQEQREEPRSTVYFFNSCYKDVPPITNETTSINDQKVPVLINSNKLIGVLNKLQYDGDVSLTHGERKLTSDKLNYFKNKNEAEAIGAVKLNNGSVTITADSLETKFDTSEATLINTKYQFHGRGGRGSAEKIYNNGQEQYKLTDSTYTSCPPGDETWSLKSSTFDIDQKADVGTAYNAVLRVKNVPVFYFPYISYPLSNKRKTGLLIPSYEATTTNGMSIIQPLYLNLREDMDATITMKYYQKRGTAFSGEYRYLSDFGSGMFQGEYMENDRIRNISRDLIHFEHSANITNALRFNTSYSHVSDNDYFSDITTTFGSRSDSQLLQTANLSYVKTDWNAELEIRDFQILSESSTPFKVLPKVAFEYHKPLNYKSLQFDWYSEITKFTHDNVKMYSGDRMHLEPKLSLPLYFNSGFINTEVKYMLTYYNQTRPNTPKYSWYNNIEDEVTRSIPSFKIHSGFNFERDLNAFGNEYQQTLVPQIQYLYVPYVDQNNIGIYDTTPLAQDYYGLFREARYSGYDRIADANQITYGISSSFIDKKGQEKMRFAVGQNFYFSPSKTFLPTNSLKYRPSKSALISTFDLNFDNQYFFHSGLDWDVEDDKITKGNAAIEKKWNYNTYAQLNYRYLAATSEQEKLNPNAPNQVNQVGTKINWSINTSWTGFVSYYYDLEFQNSYESIVGIKYQSCCWALNLTFDRYMLPYSLTGNPEREFKTEQEIKISFELMGLGSFGSAADVEGSFDYGRPFYLK